METELVKHIPHQVLAERNLLAEVSIEEYYMAD